MSPTNTESTSANTRNQPQQAMTAMRRRRDGQAAARSADDAAVRAVAGAAAETPAIAAAAEPSAPAAEPSPAEVPVPSTPMQESQIIGQELVLASEAIVPLSASRVEQPSESVRNQPEVQTPVVRQDERFQTPAQEGRSTPNGREDTQGLDRQVAIVESPPGGVNSGPTGAPRSFGPPTQSSPVNMLPLFTPEQSLQFQRMEENAPWLYQRLTPMGSQMPLALGSGRGDLPPQALHHPGMDPALQELQDQRMSEAMWKAQVEQMMNQLGLQLRASQMENARLKEEVKFWRERPSSSYHTPEDGPRGRQGGAKEDGPRGRQETVSKEDGPRGRQEVVLKEEGPRGRQEIVSKEDGLGSQQDRRDEIVRAQEELLRAQERSRELRREEIRKAQEDWTKSQELSRDELQMSPGGSRLPTSQTPSESEEEEDGAESQQEESEDEPPRVGAGGAEKSSKERPKRRSSGASDPTMKVILQLVQGMQTMQKHLLDSRDRQSEAEVVRHTTELPKLPEWDPETAPIDYSDWQLCLAAHMGDLSSTSETWWSSTMEVAKAWYGDHMRMTPMQRLTHQPKATEELQHPRWVRLERRASALLMAALPEQLREEVISSKTVSSLGIMCKAMLLYQPGGLTERAAILNALEQPQEAQTVSAAVAQVRKWIRWKRRAVELGVSMPDATILVKGLSKLLKKVISGNQDLSFRLSLARNSLLIDTIPTQESVNQYTEHVLAELEQMGHHARRKEGKVDEGPRVRKFEESGKTEEGPRGKGKPREEYEAKKSPCRFFLTDQGCRRGKQCPYGHVLDTEKRCWSCGSKEHFAGGCPRGEEGKTAKVAKAGAKSERSSKPDPTPKVSEAAGEVKPEVDKDTGEDTMRVLLDEAQKMIKSLENPEVRENKAATSGKKEASLEDLQKQLEALKRVSLRPFRISKIGSSTTRGLIDSGATHALRARRKGEKVDHLPKVSVMLAGDKEARMSLTPCGTILGNPGTEPIVPMGKLTTVLDCTVTWTPEGMVINHPQWGKLDIDLVDGCPMVAQDVALKLIEEMETKVTAQIRSLCIEENPEITFIQKIVDQHPAFQHLPEAVKSALVERPADDILLMGNRRMRKLWKKKGVLVHAFSGPNDGYTLRRAFYEVGGDKRLVYEFDILHGKEASDLSVNGKGYGQLLRLALDGKVKGWVGGPPCRTRSVLRHQEVEGLSMPRPVRSWNGGEYGNSGNTLREQKQVTEDDILMMRFVLLYVITDLVRKMNKEEEKTLLLLEQPAEPANPEVVSWWKTKEWEALKTAHGLSLQTFNQSEFGSSTTKPTSIGGTAKVQVPLKGRKGGQRIVEGKTAQQLCDESRSLSRWTPGMMRELAKVIQTTVFGQPVRIRAISWSEHVRMGHTPFRRDCRTCQMASARDFTHRRSKLPPKVGVLSLDTAGPFRVGDDLNYANSGRWKRKAKYLLVGAFTWFKNPKNPHETDEDPGEVPEEAPIIEECEDEDQRQKGLEDEGRQLEEESDGYSPSLLPEDAEQAQEERLEDPEAGGDLGGGGLDQPMSEEKEEQPEEEREFEVGVTRMCVPLPSRDKHVILRAVADFYLRLKADGYTVTQIHTDQGGEYISDVMKEWTMKRDILHTFTPGDSPQSNGRAEVAVQQIKNEIRRTLLGGGATYDRWPLAARFVNEVHRLKQVGKTVKHPGFMEKVLIRKRYWHAQELAPTQEVATYLGPSWVNHGHYIERENGFQTLTRMIMSGLKEPPEEEHWIALEDEAAPMDDRRRLRGKVAAAFQFRIPEEKSEEVEAEEEKEEVEEDHGGPKEEEGEDQEVTDRLAQVIAAEMAHLIDDHEIVAGTVYDAMASLRELQTKVNEEPELLQTKIVSQAEVRRDIQAWKPAIEAELRAMFQVKEALTKIDAKEAKELIQTDQAECLPSKMVYTLKPSDEMPSGKRKARLVVCGNFSEEQSSQSELFASGATAVALRVALALAAQFHWVGKTSDIRTAFLNAPLIPEDLDTGEEGTEPKRALIKPPALLIALGLVGSDEWWEALKAVYGYRKSPRLWSDHRDRTVRKMRIVTDQGVIVLQQMISEPNMWKVMLYETEELEGEGQLIGLVLIYVDDLLILSDLTTVDLILEKIKSVWELSQPEEINSEVGTRFLGSELWRWKTGHWMTTQKGYTVDLLRRNLGPDEEKWKVKKLPLLREPDLPSDSPGDRELLREAQRIMGELVWLSTKTRPDLMLTVSKLSALISRDPAQVVRSADQVWHYLAGTVDMGLIFSPQENCRDLNVFTDSSFNDSCQGCVLILWGSAPILWRSAKQPVVTTSTAESELVEVMEGATCGDAVRVVLEEVLDEKIRPSSFTDSSSALSIVTSESGSWRTRHLRKRANALRARVTSGDWIMRHLPGSQMPADVGTKVLSVERFVYLCDQMGMGRLPQVQEKKDSGSSRIGQKEVVKSALKAIILAAKVAQAKGEPESQEWPLGPYSPIKIYRVGRQNGVGWSELLVIAIILVTAGIFIGLLIAWMFGEGEIREVELRPRPTFLERESPLEVRSENPAQVSQATTVPAPLPHQDGGLRRRSAAAAEPPAGVAASSSAGSSSAAGRAAAGSSAAAGRAADGPAASQANAGPAAGEEGVPVVVQYPNRPRRGIYTRTFHISEAGERFHNWRTCHGLRKARHVRDVQLCTVCVEPDYQIGDEMFTSARDDTLHSSWAHAVAFSPDPSRSVTPCKLCMR